MNSYMRTAFVVALFAMGTARTPAGQSGGAAPAAPAIQPKVACEAMNGKMVPASAIGLPTNGAVVTTARMEPGTGPVAVKANFVPPYCFIRGAIKPIDPTAPDINFGVAIPTNWNQQVLQIAGNGGNGFIPLLTTLARGMAGSPTGPMYPPHVPFPIAEGFATFGDDSGHLGGGFPWNIRRDFAPLPPPGRPAEKAAPGEGGPLPGPGAINAPSYVQNDEAYRNFGHEHIKKDFDTVMYLIKEMYDVRPTRKYFAGESQGGRAGLQAATRYAGDYDGIIASVPIAYYTGRLLAGFQRAKVQMAPGAWIPPGKVRAIRDEILRQCDSLDGSADGVIANYWACQRKFDGTDAPKPFAKLRCPDGKDTGLQCLSDPQLDAITAIHAPTEIGFPLLGGDTSYVGSPLAQEIMVNASFEGPGNFGFAPLPAAPKTVDAGELGQRYPGKTFDLVNKPFSEYKQEIEAMSAIVDHLSDVNKILAGKTKFILHAGASDYTVNGRGAMQFYDAIVRKHGQAAIDRQVRFYVTPNGEHGSIGHSATTGMDLPRYADLWGALRTWVEKDVAPDSIVQTLEEIYPPYTVLRSRPLCRYPKYPKYKGSGNVSDAANYSCAMPEAGTVSKK
jgi:hypothetical protein